MLTSATLIEKFPATEQQDKRQRHLDRIRTSVKLLTGITEELLSVGKIEEGRIQAHPSEVALPALLREAVAEVQGLRKPGQRLEQHVAETGLLWLDAALLRKVLVNLLSNALKYSGDDTTVMAHASNTNNFLTISVNYQGVGIAPEDQEHLFERCGRIKIVRHTDACKELITRVYSAGEFFGYLPLLHADTAMVLNDATLLHIPKEDFTQLFHYHSVV